MDGQPPGYYGQNSWPVDGQENEEYQLTNSQTQLLADVGLLGNGEPSFIGHESIAPVETGMFPNLGADSYGNFPPMPSHMTVEDQQLYHTSHFLTVQQEQQTVSMHASSTSLNEVPAMEMWAGRLNFSVEFSKAQDRTKATPWIFSTKLKKLYVSLDKACPIFFKMDISPQEFPQYCIRGQVVYSKADHYHDNVERCPQHQGKDIPAMPFTPHVLRCDDVNTTYVIDRRHSILVPLKPPAPGTQSVTFCFRFMCLSSCIGSLNRRPTKLIFTLETLSGEAVGRYVCDVRICSCPGRDIRADEGKASEQTADEESSSNLVRIELPTVAFSSKGKTKKRKAPPATLAPLPPHNAAPSEDDDTVYNINVNVRGRAQYELVLSTVNNLLRFFETLPRNPNNQADHNDGKRFKKEQP